MFQIDNLEDLKFDGYITANGVNCFAEGMEIYNFKEERSLFGLKDSFIAALPYIILIISRLIRSIIFFVDSSYLLEYGLLDRLAAYTTTYVNAFDIALCLIPVLVLLFEKRSLLVRFHAFQYLIINTFIPLIYLLIISIIFMISRLPPATANCEMVVPDMSWIVASAPLSRRNFVHLTAPTNEAYSTTVGKHVRKVETPNMNGGIRWLKSKLSFWLM